MPGPSRNFKPDDAWTDFLPPVGLHIQKLEALEFLEEIFKRTDKLIISYSNTEQSNVRDNIYENHVSKWSIEELQQFGKVEVLNQDEVSAVLFISKI